MRKPIIGIVGKPLKNDEGNLWHKIICYSEIRYLILKNGGIAIELLPTEKTLDFEDIQVSYDKENEKKLSNEELADIERQIDLCDGIIIQGGLMSSQFEIEFAKIAIKKNKPMIGICAGFNNILRALGGNVKKDEAIGHNVYDKNYRHEINIVENSKLYELIGKTKIDVNSFHFMVATKEMVEPYATVTSYSKDGFVESFEVENKKFLLAFKWHPELMYNEEYVNKIFSEFIDISKQC